jgi:hypothetical protein
VTLTSNLLGEVHHNTHFELNVVHVVVIVSEKAGVAVNWVKFLKLVLVKWVEKYDDENEHDYSC